MKMSGKICLLTALMVAACTSAVRAQFADLGPATDVHDRSTAMASSRSTDIAAAVAALNHPKALANGKQTVSALRQLSRREDWPLPAREAAIYQFTRSLARQSSDTVDPAILEYLSAYQPQVLVEDEHGGKQALFNIRAAAAGVENDWLRTDSARQAATSLIEDPLNWLVVYVSAEHPAQRAGYLDALSLADPQTVESIQSATLEQLAGNSELTAVIALTATLNRDFAAARQLLLRGQGSQLAQALVKLSSVATKTEQISLLKFAVEQAPTTNAALAIASWAPALSADQEVRQLLLNTLADPALGSAAAMALANKPDLQTIRELQALSDGQGLGAQRAALALDINRTALIQEQRK